MKQHINKTDQKDQVTYGKLTSGVRAISNDQLLAILQDSLKLYNGEYIVGFEIDNNQIRIHSSVKS